MTFFICLLNVDKFTIGRLFWYKGPGKLFPWWGLGQSPILNSFFHLWHIFCQDLDHDDLYDAHPHCLSNTGDEDRHKGCAIQDGQPLGIQKQGAYDLGKQHCCQNMGHILLFVQEEAIAKGSDKRRQGKTGEKRTTGEQCCADEVGNHPCQPGANGPQKHPRKGDGHKGKADLQVP